MKKFFYLYSIVLSLLLLSCQKEASGKNSRIIPPDSMSLLLMKTALFEAAHQVPFYHPDSIRNKFCAFDITQCSLQRFDSSLCYYAQNMDLLKSIVKKSLDSLQNYKLFLEKKH